MGRRERSDRSRTHRVMRWAVFVIRKGITGDHDLSGFSSITLEIGFKHPIMDLPIQFPGAVTLIAKDCQLNIPIWIVIETATHPIFFACMAIAHNSLTFQIKLITIAIFPDISLVSLYVVRH